jgi:hypothetical protein
MRQVLAIVAAALAIAVLAPAAEAKHVRSVVVCGASGCRSFDARQAFLDRFNVYLPPAHRPPAAADRARWLIVRITIHDPGASWPPETWKVRFYPDAGMVHTRLDGWNTVPATTLRAYHEAASGVVPFGRAAPEEPRPSVAQTPTENADPADDRFPSRFQAGGAAVLAGVAAIIAWRSGARHRPHPRS